MNVQITNAMNRIWSGYAASQRPDAGPHAEWAWRMQVSESVGTLNRDQRQELLAVAEAMASEIRTAIY